MASPATDFRFLNDYECMLATSTCNVGLDLLLSKQTGDVTAVITDAWNQCTDHYELLSVCFVPHGTGVLGPRFRLARIEDKLKNDLVSIQHMPTDSPEISIACDLQRVGTSALEISKGSYFMECQVFGASSGSSAETLAVRVLLSLSHALSDGPGALQVAHTFLTLLGTHDSAENAIADIKLVPQPLFDLQAVLLGDDYGSNKDETEVYQHLQSYQQQLQENKPGDCKSNYLPPEALQMIPSDSSQDTQGTIDCLHFSLSVDETSALRLACRNAGATIQGAISAAVLRSRVSVLQMVAESIDAVILVPINARRLVLDAAALQHDQTLQHVLTETSCLCGSAGIVHTAKVSLQAPALVLATECTVRTRSALQDQPLEWLRRLLHTPTRLPPYSVMASSIGVSPVQDHYGTMVPKVMNCVFFGGSRPAVPASRQATMVHAVTFDGGLQVMVNFTSPGVQKTFMEEITKQMKNELLSMTLTASKQEESHD